MPCEHLRELIRDLHPNATVRQLTLAAGLDPNRIAYYLKPSTQIDSMPKLEAMKEIARALGCALPLVAEAFAADLGIPWGLEVEDPLARAVVRNAIQDPELLRLMVPLTNAPRDQVLHDLLISYLSLSRADKATLGRVAQSLAGGPG